MRSTGLAIRPHMAHDVTHVILHRLEESLESETNIILLAIILLLAADLLFVAAMFSRM
jgi:hypothetical protein